VLIEVLPVHFIKSLLKSLSVSCSIYPSSDYLMLHVQLALIKILRSIQGPIELSILEFLPSLLVLLNFCIQWHLDTVHFHAVKDSKFVKHTFVRATKENVCWAWLMIKVETAFTVDKR